VSAICLVFVINKGSIVPAQVIIDSCCCMGITMGFELFFELLKAIGVYFRTQGL